MEYREEHKREALIGTVVFHALLGAFFIFTIFKGPDPPLTEIGGGGVELNYGIDEAGSGDIQSMAPANESKNREDSRPPAARPDPTPQPARTAAEPEPQPAAQEKIVTSEAEESPVKIPPVENPAPSRPEPVRETPKPAEKPRTLYTPKGSTAGGGNGQNGTSNTPTGNNNGDKPGSVGDQGDPNGSLDAKALYGTPGSGGGSGGGIGVDMAGWALEDRPSVPLIDNSSGSIRFKIKINEDGEVESVTKVSGNVSPTQEKICRDALFKSTFRRTTSAVGGATGFATFRFTVK
ncbi:hypothetical protein [Hymenobacter sp. DG25A]|uniref:hypothetical protein n=1 Tax=Hymenobacter sp. DG25A TaxID=1385663 RepID=UPI0006BCD930|nr:hypothetical protein [Hymenobacter sp. DG25A]ALD20914.1 hypothetical protein AM218_06325 [Hymenobacter sp. DG25A]